MHDYHAVILLLSKPGHPNPCVLSLEILAVAALGQSSLVPALKAWAFTFVLIWESASVPLAMAFSKWVGRRHWHLGKGPEVLKAKSVRPAGNHEGGSPLPCWGCLASLGGQRGAPVL